MSAAFFLLICGYFGDTIPMVITFLAVSVGMGGFVAGGHSVNHLDIGASYAGILMGITNMCGTIPGFIGPQVAKLIAATVCTIIARMQYLLRTSPLACSASSYFRPANV